jgi:type II secretory pathway pseudopilin PulG
MSHVKLASRRPGLTLIELLVVLGLLLFAIGLFLPAVQLVRQAAARTESANNMHQIMIAMHSFHDTYGYLPMALGFNGKPGKDWMTKKPAIHGTAFFHILPFLEQQKVFNDSEGMSNKSKGVVIPQYLAPADFTVPAKRLTDDNQGAISYAANAITLGHIHYGKDPVKNPMPQGAKMTLVKLTTLDGTSNTIGIAERFARCIANEPGGKVVDYQRAWSEDGKGETPHVPALWKHNVPPQFGAAMKADQGPKGKTPCNPEAAQSFDGSVLQVGMCDGHVHAVSRKITAQTWSDALTPDDGNALGPDF